MEITQRLTGNRGWRRMLCVAAVAVAAAGWCSSAAWAANAADLSITLATTPSDSVSISRTGLTTYVAYRVTLANSSKNAINQVRLTGATTVTGDTNGSTPASYYGVVGNGTVIQPSCLGVGTPSVTCTIGQMKSRERSDFFLIFQTPSDETPSDGMKLQFTLTSTFSQEGSAASPPANVVGATLISEVGLTTTTTDQINTSVKTVLPPIGGTFLTGFNGAVNATNPFSSVVTLPGVANLVTSNRINQTTVPSFACDGSYFCFGLKSDISVDNARDASKVFYAPGQSITMVLRQDISTLFLVNGKRKIGDVKIFYNPNPAFPGDVGTLVPACTPALPTPDHPCISARVDNTSGNTGYYEYWLRGSDNGVFSW
jgi:hypothetical protein